LLFFFLFVTREQQQKQCCVLYKLCSKHESAQEEKEDLADGHVQQKANRKFHGERSFEEEGPHNHGNTDVVAQCSKCGKQQTAIVAGGVNCDCGFSVESLFELFSQEPKADQAHWRKKKPDAVEAKRSPVINPNKPKHKQHDNSKHWQSDFCNNLAKYRGSDCDEVEGIN
jgi:hypothetical protein